MILIKTKEDIIEEALMVSDCMAICNAQSSTGDIWIRVYNINRIHNQMLLRLENYEILSTNMSNNMQKRALSVVKRNVELIREIEGMKYA